MNEIEEAAQYAMEIIGFAGEAISKIHKALELCTNGDFTRAKKLLEEAEDLIIKAHKVSFNLISAEARGERRPITLLLVHALDTLMTSIIERDLVKRIIAILELISSKIDEKQHGL